MIDIRMKRGPASRLTRLALALCLGTAAASAWPRAAVAEDAASETGVELRLLAGPVVNGVGRAGLEIGLEPGWKTYWRYPGDSGVPPDLDTTGSTNVAGIDIGFPPPERSGPPSEQTIGYHAPVTLILNVRLVDPARPADLVVAARLGVCRDICVPVEAQLKARFDPKVAPDAGTVADLARVAASLPQPVTAGQPFSVTSLVRRPGSPETVAVTVTAPTGKLKDVFVEGPDGWALPLPDRTGGDGERSTWTFALDGLPGGARISGTPLTFTIVGDGAATVQQWTLP